MHIMYIFSMKMPKIHRKSAWKRLFGQELAQIWEIVARAGSPSSPVFASLRVGLRKFVLSFFAVVAGAGVVLEWTRKCHAKTVTDELSTVLQAQLNKTPIISHLPHTGMELLFLIWGSSLMQQVLNKAAWVLHHLKVFFLFEIVVCLEPRLVQLSYLLNILRPLKREGKFMIGS